MEIQLHSVGNEDIYFLYDLLNEREKVINISHKKLPAYSEHETFVKNKPYLFWEIIFFKIVYLILIKLFCSYRGW